MTDTARRRRRRSRETGGPGPLAGVRVVELGMLLAGPFTGRLLGDMGAEIIKVERPAARPDARVGPGALRGPLALVAGAVAEQEVRHAQPPLKARAAAAPRRSPSQSDVLVENFRPGTLERWAHRPGAALGGQPGARDRARLGLRPDGAVRAARRLRRPSPRRWADPLHQRLPGRAAAPDPHLARRLARRHVRRAGHPRRALLARARSAAGAARSSTSP